MPLFPKKDKVLFYKSLFVFFVLSCFYFSTVQAIAKPQYIEGEVLVQFKKTTQINKLAKKYQLTKKQKNNKLVLFQSTEKTDELIELLKKDKRVADVQPNYLYYMASETIPWGIDTNGVKAIEVQTSGYTGNGVIVAVIDTGVLYTHEDLDANMWSPTNGDCIIRSVSISGGCPNHGYDFADEDNDPADDNGHGTHVTGTIAAEDNDVGVVGVAPQAQIMAVKVLPSTGWGTTLDISEGIDFARENGADVINLSIRGYSWDPIMHQAVSDAITAGVVVVIATGNERENLLTYPAANADAIAVGAAQETIDAANPDEDMQTRLAYFSNYGRVDVVAPGMRINSTTYDGSYSGDTWEGTSMATPHVAGVAALIRQKYSDLIPAKVKQILMTTAQDLGETGVDQDFGAGLVDAVAALGTLNNSLVLQANFTANNADVEPTYYLPVLPADGISTTKIKLTLMDNNLNLVNGQSVVFSDGTATVTDANGQATIDITASSEEGSTTITADAGIYGTASVTIYFTKTLLVSDAFEYNDLTVYSWFYDQTLSDLGYYFVRWDTGLGYPSTEYLQKFDKVFWYTADYYLDDSSQEVLKTYLDAGGNLFLSGNDIGYYIAQGIYTDTIYSSYLQASFAGDNGGQDIIGESIFADLSFLLIDRLYVNGFVPDYITTTGTSAGYFSTDATLKAGTIIDSTYNAVYLSFGFEAIYNKATRDATLQAVYLFFNDITPPINLQTGNVTISQATLSWDAVTDATSYILSYGTDELATDLGTTTTTEPITTLTNLTANTLYYVKVAAVTEEGTTSYSDILSFATLPNKPTKIKIKNRQTNQIELSWQAPSGTITGYTIKYGKTKKVNKKVTTGKTERILKNLKSNQKYYLKIKATGLGGESAWTQIIDFRTKPAKPRNLRVANLTSTAADLHWDAVRGKIKKYIIKIYTASDKYFGTFKTNKTKKYITSLTPNTTYYFKVYAQSNKHNISQRSAKTYFKTAL